MVSMHRALSQRLMIICPSVENMSMFRVTDLHRSDVKTRNPPPRSQRDVRNQKQKWIQNFTEAVQSREFNMADTEEDQAVSKQKIMAVRL